MADLTQPEIAYVAGILDAMARIKTTTVNGTELPLVAVSGPNMPLLGHLSKVSGLKAFETHREYDRHRCGEHCAEAHDHIVSRSGRWAANGARATIMLAAVQPHIRVQVDEVAEVLAIGLKTPAKGHTVEKMARLGWPIPEEWVLHHTGRGLVVLRGSA